MLDIQLGRGIHLNSQHTVLNWSTGVWTHVGRDSMKAIEVGWPCSVHPFQGAHLQIRHQLRPCCWCQEPCSEPMAHPELGKALLLKLHILTHSRVHTPFTSLWSRLIPSILNSHSAFFLNAELRRWKVGTWSESSRNQESHPELTLVPSASTSPSTASISLDLHF